MPARAWRPTQIPAAPWIPRMRAMPGVPARVRIFCRKRSRSAAELLRRRATLRLHWWCAAAPGPRGSRYSRVHANPLVAVGARLTPQTDNLANRMASNSCYTSTFQRSQLRFEHVERIVKPRFDGRHGAREDLRHLFELESLINFQDDGFSLIRAELSKRGRDRDGKLQRKCRAACGNVLAR